MLYFRFSAHPRAAITGPNSKARSSDVSEFQGDDWMEMFTSDHLSHTNYCVCQSGNYLQSNSKNHAIKFIIMVAFNYKRQGPTYRKFTEGRKWFTVTILILIQRISFGKVFSLLERFCWNIQLRTRIQFIHFPQQTRKLLLHRLPFLPLNPNS